MAIFKQNGRQKFQNGCQNCCLACLYEEIPLKEMFLSYAISKAQQHIIVFIFKKYVIRENWWPSSNKMAAKLFKMAINITSTCVYTKKYKKIHYFMTIVILIIVEI